MICKDYLDVLYYKADTHYQGMHLITAREKE